ncbi:MAG: DUF2007 domain-containing protein [Halanaerobiales bacterium]|nr:DUF2007 domain-containing protein [Halanaerobiales bacterium]
MSEMNWVVLTITDQITADIYKSLLETNDIPVFLRSDASHSVHPFTVGMLGDVDIMVLKVHLEDAKALMEEAEIIDDLSEDDKKN